MFCAKCGAELNGAAFCAACGTEVNPSVAVPIQPTPNSYQVPMAPNGFAPKPPTNGLAIAGFVVSLVCGGPVGFVLSLVALNQISKSPTPQGGKGLAIAGAIIGGLSSLYLIFAVGAFFNAFTSGY